MTLEFDPSAKCGPEFYINDNIKLSLPKYYRKKSLIFSYKRHVENVKEILEKYDEFKTYHTSFEYGDFIRCIIVVGQTRFKYSIIPGTNGGSHVSFSVNYKENKENIDKFLKYMVDIEKLDDTEEESTNSINLGGDGGGGTKRKRI